MWMATGNAARPGEEGGPLAGITADLSGQNPAKLFISLTISRNILPAARGLARCAGITGNGSRKSGKLSMISRSAISARPTRSATSVFPPGPLRKGWWRPAGAMPRSSKPPMPSDTRPPSSARSKLRCRSPTNSMRDVSVSQIIKLCVQVDHLKTARVLLRTIRSEKTRADLVADHPKLIDQDAAN